jgi:hypothetical protein
VSAGHSFDLMAPNNVADPDPGSGAFLTPGSGILDEQPGSYFLELRNNFLGVKILKFFDADPGWRQFESGMEQSRIRDKHPGSATLAPNIAESKWCEKIKKIHS